MAQELINRFRSFREGHLVLARIARHPYWPATIAPCKDNADEEYFGSWKRPDKKGGSIWCEFIGMEDNPAVAQKAWIDVDNVKPFTNRDADYSICRCRSMNTKERLSTAVKIALEKHPSFTSHNGLNPNTSNRTARLSLPQQNEDINNKFQDKTPSQNNKQGTPPPSSENPEDEDEDDDSDDEAYDRGIDANEKAVLESSYTAKIKNNNAKADVVPDMNTISLIGDLVLAKTGSYPFWPAIVSKCVSEKEKWDDKWVLFGTKDKPIRVWCSFVGDSTGGWVPLDRMRPYVPAVAEKLMSKPKTRLYNDHLKAVQMANKMYLNKRRLKVYPPENEQDPARNEKEANGPGNSDNHITSSQNEIVDNNASNLVQDEIQPASGDVGQPQNVPTAELEYSEKDIVLAKFDESLPFWPALIHKCREPTSDPNLLGKWHAPATERELERFCCYFLEDGSECWVPLQQMKMFSVHRAKKYLCSRSNELYENQKKAIDEATRLFKQRQEDEENRRINWDVGDIVLAKFTECPFWPARIQKCTSTTDSHYDMWKKQTSSNRNSGTDNIEAGDPGREGDSSSKEQTNFWCSFLQIETSYWVDSADIKPFKSARARRYYVEENHSLFDRQKKAITLASEVSLRAIFNNSAAAEQRGDTHIGNGHASQTNIENGKVLKGPTLESTAAASQKGRNSRDSETAAVNPWRTEINEPMTPRNEPMTPKNTSDPPPLYYLGDLVLVPFRDSAYWPARIVPCPRHEEQPWRIEAEDEESTSYWCAYIHHPEAVWVLDTELKPFTPHRARRYLVPKTSKLGKKHREAVKKASEICRNMRNRVEVSLTEYLDSSIIEEMEAMDYDDDEQVENAVDDELAPSFVDPSPAVSGGEHTGKETRSVKNSLPSNNNSIPPVEKTVDHVRESSRENKSVENGNKNLAITPPVGDSTTNVQKEVSTLGHNVSETSRVKEPQKPSAVNSVPSAAVTTKDDAKVTKMPHGSGQRKDPVTAPPPAIGKAISMESSKYDTVALKAPIPRIQSPTPMRSPTSMASTSGQNYLVPLPTPLTASIASNATKIPIPRSVSFRGTKSGSKTNTASYSSSEGGRRARGSRFTDITPQDTSAKLSRFSNASNGAKANNIRNSISNDRVDVRRVDAPLVKTANGNGSGQHLTQNGNGQKDNRTNSFGLGKTGTKNNSISNLGKRQRTEVIEASGSTIKRQK